MSNKQCDVDKNDVSLIKALASPPRLVKEELSVTALLLGLPEHQTKVCSYMIIVSTILLVKRHVTNFFSFAKLFL